jgi:hypothetical protein
MIRNTVRLIYQNFSLTIFNMKAAGAKTNSINGTGENKLFISYSANFRLDEPLFTVNTRTYFLSTITSPDYVIRLTAGIFTLLSENKERRKFLIVRKQNVYMRLKLSHTKHFNPCRDRLGKSRWRQNNTNYA